MQRCASAAHLLLFLVTATFVGAAGGAAAAASPPPPTWHICTMIKRDARFLAEWLEFHHSLAGASSFTVYDHSSVDAPELGRVLAAYVGPHQRRSGGAAASADPWLELVAWPPHTRAEAALLAGQRVWSHPGEARLMRQGLEHCRAVMRGGGNPIGCQEAARADCFARHGHHAAFLAFIDTDEFVVAPRGAALAALSDLRRAHPGAAAFYLPSITWGSSHLTDLPAGRLVVETFTRRAPFEELGDDAAAITRRIANCSVRTRSYPNRTLCTVDHGKHIYANRSAVFDMSDAGGGGGGRRGFVERLRGLPLAAVTVPRGGPLRLHHYQHRGLADLAARGADWGKSLNVEQAQGAPAFWNAVEDRILAGNATLLRELRAAMRRRRRGLGGSGG